MREALETHGLPHQRQHNTLGPGGCRPPPGRGALRRGVRRLRLANLPKIWCLLLCGPHSCPLPHASLFPPAHNASLRVLTGPYSRGPYSRAVEMLGLRTRSSCSLGCVRQTSSSTTAGHCTRPSPATSGCWRSLQLSTTARSTSRARPSKSPSCFTTHCLHTFCRTWLNVCGSFRELKQQNPAAAAALLVPLTAAILRVR